MCWCSTTLASSAHASTINLSVTTASAWTVEHPPDPTGKTGLFQGVACVSASFCEAVGVFGGEVTEAWDGTAWTVQTNPQNAELFAVSCGTANACFAVGQATQAAAIVFWNGTTWANQTAAEPTGTANALFYAVSCSASTNCMAFGVYSTSPGGPYSLFANHWDGLSWTLSTMPQPTGSAIQAYGLSCTSTSFCMAVGDYRTPAEDVASLAEAWNGSTWTLEPPANPTTGNFLYGVSCINRHNCTAVGTDFIQSTGSQALAEHWNGNAWSVQPDTLPPNTVSELLSVSCSSGPTCTAVGRTYSTLTSTGTPYALIEVWNGSAWTVQTTPGPKGKRLWAVSCPSANSCAAVGDYLKRPLAETENL